LYLLGRRSRSQILGGRRVKTLGAAFVVELGQTRRLKKEHAEGFPNKLRPEKKTEEVGKSFRGAGGMRIEIEGQVGEQGFLIAPSHRREKVLKEGGKVAGVPA